MLAPLTRHCSRPADRNSSVGRNLMMLSRRALLRLAVPTSIALLATACGSPAPPPAPTPAGSAPAAAPTAAPAATTAPAAPKAAEGPTRGPAAKDSPPAAATDPRAKSEAELPKGEVTVNFWHSTDATTNKLYTETFIAGYKRLRPNYTIQE